jgi:predicted dehydrogenase
MLSIGVIGYGYWGPNLARNASEVPGARLHAVADRSAAALARASARHPGIEVYTDAEELIADKRIDAVLIATPVSTHFSLAMAALSAGKHVLIEKPMTASSREARALIELADRRRLVLMVDHTFVYTPAVRKIRELTSNGALGDIYYYDSTRINLGLFQSDVNVIWDLAVHDLGILDFLFGESPHTISASGVGHIEGRPENIAHVTMFYRSGTVANVNVNWLAPVKVRQTLIGGSKKMIVYDDLQPSEKIKVYDRGVDIRGVPEMDARSLRIEYRMGDMWAPQLSVREAILTGLEHFLECIEKGERPCTAGDSGLRVVQLLEAAMQSIGKRGAPVEVPIG